MCGERIEGVKEVIDVSDGCLNDCRLRVCVWEGMGLSLWLRGWRRWAKAWWRTTVWCEWSFILSMIVLCFVCLRVRLWMWLWCRWISLDFSSRLGRCSCSCRTRLLRRICSLIVWGKIVMWVMISRLEFNVMYLCECVLLVCVLMWMIFFVSRRLRMIIWVLSISVRGAGFKMVFRWIERECIISGDCCI